MYLLLIGKQKNCPYLFKDIVTFLPVFTHFCEPWNSNFLWRIIMQTILHQSGQHDSHKVQKNAPKQHPLLRISLNLLSLFLLSLFFLFLLNFLWIPYPIKYQMGRDCTYTCDFEHSQSWKLHTIKHFLSITNHYFCS